MNIPLSIFPAPLLRLILCGGNGLPSAWGPLMERVDDEPENDRRWTLDRYGHVMNREHLGSRTPMSEEAGRWFMPLDDASPWPARLAMVAACLESFLLRAPASEGGLGMPLPNGPPWIARVGWTDDRDRNPDADRMYLTYSWGAGWHTSHYHGFTGRNIINGSRGPSSYPKRDLLTLPAHQAGKPLAVGFLLALYDVPEIRARVESA